MEEVDNFLVKLVCGNIEGVVLCHPERRCIKTAGLDEGTAAGASVVHAQR